MKKRIVFGIAFVLMAIQAIAQGLVVNKKDGTKLYIPAEQVESVSTYGYDEGIEARHHTYVVNGVIFTMLDVAGGTFQMGSEDSDAYSDEKPVHQVTLSDFSIAQTEVMQELWEAVMGSNPSNFKGAKRPVENVSWDKCQTFITKLNGLTGQNFRLPTEAEWEFAARGGNNSMGYKYAGSNSIDDVAWYSNNSSSMIHEVGTKLPNELGLYDMSGNVLEWCQDWYSNSYYSSSVLTNPQGPDSSSRRVYRGGGWYFNAGNCRVTYRGSSTPTYASSYLGFRLALSSSPKEGR